MRPECTTRGILLTSLVFLNLVLMPVLKLNAGEIHEAAKAGDATKVQALLDEGTYINSTPDNGFGWTPLHFAIAAGATRIAEILLARGASLTARAFTDEEAIELITAAQRGTTTVWTSAHGRLVTSESRVVVLPEAESKFDYHSGSTPLDFAVEKKNLEMVRLLLSKGADVNLATSGKRTPLHIAAEMGDSDVASLLLQNGANVNARDYFGHTPWDVARGNEGMKRLLAPP